MPQHLSLRPIHLGLGGTATAQPEFEGNLQWYEAYARRTEEDGVDGRLVTLHEMTGSWSSWEMHPNGHEVVVCVQGEMTLVQEIEGEHRRTTLRGGEYAINPPGVWHTADIDGTVTALFITAGKGTIHRPR
jgi:quercetin dioxygenase-like cupin family protein